MAGIRGFEPLNDGIKTRCLTAWLYPCNVLTFYIGNLSCLEMVRVKRLELSHLAILEPKSSASTNSAKPALFLHLTESNGKWWLHRDSNLGPHHYE